MCKEFFTPSKSFERQDVNKHVRCIGENDTHMKMWDVIKGMLFNNLWKALEIKSTCFEHHWLKQMNNTQTYIPKCVKGDDALNSTNISELETITTFQAYIIECKMKATMYWNPIFNDKIGDQKFANRTICFCKPIR